MSDSDHSSGPKDSEQIAAAEYVLGVLNASERAEFERKMSRDPATAAEVSFWEERLGSLADAVTPVTPPPAVWSAIDQRLGTRPQGPSARLWDTVGFWRSFAIASAVTAAASLGFIAYTEIAAPVRAPLVATLSAGNGTTNFVAAVDAGRRSMLVIPASSTAADAHSLELWLIPQGDRPYSLGLLTPGQPSQVVVPVPLAQRVGADATLAISLEPAGGSPTGQPTGPVLASGKLTRL